MKKAFLTAFDDGFDSVVLIGSDSPDLPQAYIKLAFSALKTNDVVLGPSSDGGYYLIGMTQNYDIFENIPWSTSKVFEKTIEKIDKLGLKIKTLSVLYDIDTNEDWERAEKQFPWLQTMLSKNFRDNQSKEFFK